jgi:hypothetical protein
MVRQLQREMASVIYPLLAASRYSTCCLSLRADLVPYSLMSSVYLMGDKGFEDGDGSSWVFEASLMSTLFTQPHVLPWHCILAIHPRFSGQKYILDFETDRSSVEAHWRWPGWLCTRFADFPEGCAASEPLGLWWEVLTQRAYTFWHTSKVLCLRAPHYLLVCVQLLPSFITPMTFIGI